MASKNQISQWAQLQHSNETQKQLITKLKMEGAKMLKDIYEAILHIKDYCEKLRAAISISRKENESTSDIRIILREDCKPLMYFCQCVERVLLFGYKKKFFRSSSIWSFLSDSTAKSFPLCEQLATDINLVKSIDVLNEDGKTRAFLRQALRSKLLPLYFKLILEQHEIIQDYYWDFGVMSQQNQAIALLAQLDELNYLPQIVEFQMLLSDKSLNIIENFKIDDYGVPQWHIKSDKGDISMMTDIWLLKNRDNIGIDINVKKTKKKKVKSKPKRKLNILQSTDDIRSNFDNDENVKLQIADKKSNKNDEISILNHTDEYDKKNDKLKKKKRKKKKEKDEKSKKKKKKKDRDKKKRKKHKNDSQSLLYKQTVGDATVIDDSEYIQNILEKEKLQTQTQPKSPGVFLRTTPTSSPKIVHMNINNNNNNINELNIENMSELNIDNIIDEHNKEEAKKAQIDKDIQLLKTPNKNKIIDASQSTPNSIKTSPKPIKHKKSSPKPIKNKTKPNNSQTWFKRHRSSSLGELIEYKPQKSLKKSSYVRPNSFLRGTSTTNRPYEIIVIHRRKQNKHISNGSSTPPPKTPKRNNRHKQKHDNRRYLQANKSINISQSSSPTISIEHKIIRNNNPNNYKSHRHKSHLKYVNTNQNDTDEEEDELSDYTNHENINKIKNNLGLIAPTNQINANRKPRSSSSIIESPKIKDNAIETEIENKNDTQNNDNAPDLQIDTNQTESENNSDKKVNFIKPKLSKKAKAFVSACSGSNTDEIEQNEQIENTQTQTDEISKNNNKNNDTQVIIPETESKENVPCINTEKVPIETKENIDVVQTENKEDIKVENNIETEKIDATVEETRQNREHDEYDSEEDTQQGTTNYYPFSSNVYLAASEPAQYLDQYLPSSITQHKPEPAVININEEYNSYEEETEEHTDSETKRMRLRRERDESLRRSAMELDRRFSMPKQKGMVYKPPGKIGRSVSQFKLCDKDSDSDSVRRTNSTGIYDIIEQDEKQSNLASILANKANDNNDNEVNNNTVNENNDVSENDIFESPIPKDQKDRFSTFMTQQFIRKKRAESDDLSIYDHESPPNYLSSPYFSKNKLNESPSDSTSFNKSINIQNKRIPTAIFAHSELKQEGSEKRDAIKANDWHSGIEISWRTTPVPPRDNNALLLEQNFHCATCGLVLKSNFLRRARYHYCRYLGLIHCNECHKKETAVIPHRVLHYLDCKPAMVCVAAKKYLDQMYKIPCITMDKFSQEDKVQNHKKIKQLKKILFELKAIKKYLDQCRDKNELLDNIYKEYHHWIKHAGSLSLDDCVKIVSFNLGDKLQILSNKLQKHILIDCDMCRGKGSYCEICNNQKVIYLFQYQKIQQCNVCKASFHIQCWEKVNKNCPRCKRRRKVMPQIK